VPWRIVQAWYQSRDVIVHCGPAVAALDQEIPHSYVKSQVSGGIEIVLDIELVIPRPNFNPWVLVVLGVSKSPSDQEIGYGVAGHASVEIETPLLVLEVHLRFAVVNDLGAELQGMPPSGEREIVLESVNRVLILERTPGADAGKTLRQGDVRNQIEPIRRECLGNSQVGRPLATPGLVGDGVE